MKKLSEIKKSYIAGFVDGEGCIRLHKEKKIRPFRKNHYYCLVVSVANTKFGILPILKKKYGGHLALQSRDETRVNIWNWKICGKKAGIFLIDIYKYLIIKRKQARKGIKFQNFKNNIGHRGKHNEYCNKEIKYMEKYYLLFKTMNKRGKNG